MLPPTGTPPGFDVNVVSGRVSFWLSKLSKKNSLFLMIGPPTHSPVSVVLKVPGIEREARGLRADVRLVAVPRVERTSELVGSASGDRVDVGADEVALPDVVRRDADLHLLDRLERDGRDAGAIAGLAGRRVQTKRSVEVRAVDRDVVRAVVLSGERALPAVLRRETDDVREAAGDRRQRREIVARHRGGGAGAAGAEDRIERGRHGHFFGDRRDLQFELEIRRRRRG